MVTKSKARSEVGKKKVKRIIDSELRKGAVIYNRRWLYRATPSGNEIQTDRLTGERVLVSGVKPEKIRVLG